MTKVPTQLPKVGDRVRLRGRKAVGKLRRVGTEMSWCEVDWDEGPQGPRLTHLYELELVK